MNVHEPFRSDLPLYLTGDLAPHAEDALEAHLAGCPECRRELAAQGTTLEMLVRAAGDDAFPPVALAARRVRLARYAWRAAALLLAFLAGLAARGGGADAAPAAPAPTASPAAYRAAEAPQTNFGRAALLFRSR